jgi:hypothetical protein
MTENAIPISRARQIGRDVAESELQRFIEAMDLQEKLAGNRSEDEAAALEKNKERIITAMMRGNLVIDEKGQPVYTPQVGICEPLTFYEPDGATFMAMDGAAKGKDMERMFRVMGNACKVDPSRFSKMKSRDLGVCIAIITLFLVQ